MKIFDSKTISEAFLLRCKNFPHRVGFRYKANDKWHEVTFGQQLETVRRLSIGLQEHGVEKGDKVAILAQTSLAWGQFDMAILGCGGVTIPIYPTSTPEDMTYIINHSEVSTLFVDDYKNFLKIKSIASACKGLKKVVIRFDYESKNQVEPFEVLPWNNVYDLGLNHEGTGAAKFERILQEANPADVFTIGYTSGTTGLPKGAILTHSCMASVMSDVGKVMLKYDGRRRVAFVFADEPYFWQMGKSHSLFHGLDTKFCRIH